jgi:hypothetical protein
MIGLKAATAGWRQPEHRPTSGCVHASERTKECVDLLLLGSGTL